MANTWHTSLIMDACNMAVAARQPEGVVRHSDRGSQYTSRVFGQRCAEPGMRPSTGSVADACDNAMAKAFFATLECELLGRQGFRSQAEARMAASIQDADIPASDTSGPSTSKGSTCQNPHDSPPPSTVHQGGGTPTPRTSSPG